MTCKIRNEIPEVTVPEWLFRPEKACFIQVTEAACFLILSYPSLRAHSPNPAGAVCNRNLPAK